MAIYQNVKEYFHQHQNSTRTPMVSLGYLWERRKDVYGILTKSDGVFSSKLALECVSWQSLKFSRAICGYIIFNFILLKRYLLIKISIETGVCVDINEVIDGSLLHLVDCPHKNVAH